MQIHIKKSTLQGKIRISGAKNSVLKLLSASILTSESIYLDNYASGLLDAQSLIKMISALGKSCKIDGSRLLIEEKIDNITTLDWTERSIRTTLLLLGGLLSRKGSGKVPLPGGCKLGDRKHDLHLMIFEKMGAKVWEENGYVCAKAIDGVLYGADITLPIRSTGATENAIICGCLAQGNSVLRGPHIRPEVVDLVDFLNKMGADIKIFGQERIDIKGVERLHGTSHKVMPDSLEALTWLIAGIITNSSIQIDSFPYKQLEVPLIYLRESGGNFVQRDNTMIVYGGNPYPVEISTGPFPGINSDMQPLFAIFAACANGKSKILDLRFHDRYQYTTELAKLGVQSKVNGRELSIEGGHKLHGNTVTAIDLRAGAALLLAGLVAEGETIINQSWMILRGYDQIIEKLKMLNADIEVANDH